MLTSILTLIGAFLPNILQSFGVISPAIANLISQLEGVIPGLVAKLTAGGTPTDDELALLQAFQAEIVALQQNTTLNPQDLAIAAALNSALTDALAAYQEAVLKDDPSDLTPLPTDLKDVAPVDPPNPNPDPPVSDATPSAPIV